jgi:hypothetical protein
LAADTWVPLYPAARANPAAMGKAGGLSRERAAARDRTMARLDAMRAERRGRRSKRAVGRGGFRIAPRAPVDIESRVPHYALSFSLM